MALISMIPSQTSGGGGDNPHASWFGTGEDGDAVISTDTPLPVGLDEGQINKQNNHLIIEQGGTLRPANRCNGMILLVKGDLTVDGTISADKCAPLLNPNEELAAQETHIVACGALVGGAGGKGGTLKSGIDFRGAPGNGGSGFTFGGGFGGGSGGGISGWRAPSGSKAYAGGDGDPRPPVGTALPTPGGRFEKSTYGAGGGIDFRGYTYGGGGPGGSGAAGSQYDAAENHWMTGGGTGEAIGGGAIWIFVHGKIRINSVAKISADGGNGANGVSTHGGCSAGGGGGGGGIIAIIHTGDYVNQGSITANGGTGGNPGLDTDANAGVSGSAGTILIKNISEILKT